MHAKHAASQKSKCTQEVLVGGGHAQGGRSICVDGPGCTQPVGDACTAAAVVTGSGLGGAACMG